MRKRRIDARTRVIVRECLSGQRGPAETCELLSPRLSWDKNLVSEEDLLIVNSVANSASVLPVGQRLDYWHPDFVEKKLEALAELETKVDAEVKAICERILQAMKMRQLEKNSLRVAPGIANRGARSMVGLKAHASLAQGESPGWGDQQDQRAEGPR